ncbi:pyridoxamine 5'-phosphate oxidase family protein [Fulvivirgaceae bacterium PWU4]|uniref:Pyridoxamine 5'-phosphate oxidase family protein n=1 Tax=Chryseosolibacter histidini TaxID=2782349 RepID=A0AAP2GKV4_9BACT|nr:pyridoxamine 5'-phosphate oxidase family protein [Chryseosolibacter histidini]MBT1699444.1 pyridoxamine 5'-phosphate oxidase family protein [Chryseosolibacter histidini]
MADFSKTDKTTITRLPKRGVYDQETVYAILDEALFCTVAYVREGEPFQIPTGFCRMGDKLYIHGSVGSFYMRELAEKNLPVCISATLIDGLVLARSAFHHSVNYRSVVMFAKPEKVTDEAELYTAFEVFTNKMQPGRWDDVRKPGAGEWKATMVLSFRIEEASAKVRTGGPKDDDEDYALPVWAGVVPLRIEKQSPVADELRKKDVPLPSYLKA